MHEGEDIVGVHNDLSAAKNDAMTRNDSYADWYSIETWEVGAKERSDRHVYRTDTKRFI